MSFSNGHQALLREGGGRGKARELLSVVLEGNQDHRGGVIHIHKKLEGHPESLAAAREGHGGKPQIKGQTKRQEQASSALYDERSSTEILRMT